MRHRGMIVRCGESEGEVELDRIGHSKGGGYGAPQCLGDQNVTRLRACLLGAAFV